MRLEKPPLSFYLGPYLHTVKMKSKYALLSIQYTYRYHTVECL
jgi:hypothetical protein